MPSTFSTRIVVVDTDAAERTAVELIRNILVAHSGANVKVTGVAAWPRIRSFLTSEAQRFGCDTDPSRGHWDVYINGDNHESALRDTVHTTITLPGVENSVVAERRIELVIGQARGEVIVIPGTGHITNGNHNLAIEALGRLKAAEQIVRQRQVRAVILSGWNGSVEGSASEAAQMLAAWRGRQVPMILDEAARTTAENALWSASFVAALGDVRRVRVMTSWVSAIRLGLASFAAYRKTNVSLRLSVVWGRQQAASWRPALEGLLHLRRHLRVGRALLANGPDNADAQL